MKNVADPFGARNCLLNMVFIHLLDSEGVNIFVFSVQIKALTGCRVVVMLNNFRQPIKHFAMK